MEQSNQSMCVVRIDAVYDCGRAFGTSATSGKTACSGMDPMFIDVRSVGDPRS